jgi:hypothetical protein
LVQTGPCAVVVPGENVDRENGGRENDRRQK